MNKLTFYEQVGIVIPGSVFLFGLMFYVHQFKDVLAKDGMSVGGLGVFVLIAYATGHILAAIGNVIEGLYWRIRGGMPSNWIIGEKPRLLSTDQIERVHGLVAARFTVELPVMARIETKQWFPLFRQIYSDVETHGKVSRADAFNGGYGLNRGLGAATLALTITAMLNSMGDYCVWGGLLAASCMYFYRMHRFGVHYAREVYVQFLILPPVPAEATKKRKKSRGTKSESTAKDTAPEGK
jgi:hypothetical protein